MFKIIDGGTKPHIKTEFSSSADLCAREKVVIGAGETKIIPLGVMIDLNFLYTLPEVLEVKKIYDFQKNHNPDGDIAHWKDVSKNTIYDFMCSHFFELKLRSSLAVKKGLIIANGVGEIDIDYPDEIGLIVHNPFTPTHFYNDNNMTMKFKGKKDTSITIEAGERVAQIKLMPHKNYLMPDEYKSIEKRTGGFGSTDKSYNDHPESCQCEECQNWQNSYNKRNNTTY